MEDVAPLVWVKAAAVADIPPGGVVEVEIDGQPIALYRLEDGAFYATDGICTHAHAHLSEGYLEDGVIECPYHAGCFDVRTGRALGEPATVDLATYPVRVEGGDLLIGIGRRS